MFLGYQIVICVDSYFVLLYAYLLPLFNSWVNVHTFVFFQAIPEIIIFLVIVIALPALSCNTWIYCLIIKGVYGMLMSYLTSVISLYILPGTKNYYKNYKVVCTKNRFTTTSVVSVFG